MGSLTIFITGLSYPVYPSPLASQRILDHGAVYFYPYPAVLFRSPVQASTPPNLPSYSYPRPGELRLPVYTSIYADRGVFEL